MRLASFNPRNLRFSPKRVFRSKDRSAVSRSATLSFGSASASASDSSSDGPSAARKIDVALTPTSVLPEGDWAETPPLDQAPTRDAYSELLLAFKMIDRDDDGVVSRTELESLLSRLGPEPPSLEEVRLMLSEVDCDGDGCVSLEDLAGRVAGAGAGAALQEMRETFEFFDADGDGKISVEELLRVFRGIGDERCTLDDCRRMIASVDSSGAGFVCFEDFVRMMGTQR